MQNTQRCKLRYKYDGILLWDALNRYIGKGIQGLKEAWIKCYRQLPAHPLQYTKAKELLTAENRNKIG